jgi:hypothetical protein
MLKRNLKELLVAILLSSFPRFFARNSQNVDDLGYSPPHLSLLAAATTTTTTTTTQQQQQQQQQQLCSAGRCLLALQPETRVESAPCFYFVPWKDRKV